MKQFSNRYIFIFSTVMVVIVASLLSLAATSASACPGNEPGDREKEKHARIDPDTRDT